MEVRHRTIVGIVRQATADHLKAKGSSITDVRLRDKLADLGLDLLDKVDIIKTVIEKIGLTTKQMGRIKADAEMNSVKKIVEEFERVLGIH